MQSNTTKFIEKATNIHGTLYNYSNTIYYKALEKVDIMCNTCNIVFRQRPANHLNGSGCPKCKGTSNTTIASLDSLVVGLPYKFDFSNYVNGKSLIPIYCKQHNTTTVRTVSHIKDRKTYCSLCVKEQNAISKQKKAMTTFITKSNKIHKNVYDYSKVYYVSATSKVDILCKECGVTFSQEPHNHVRGSGCPKCAGDLQGWGKTRFTNKPTIFYVIEVDSVFKVGITTRTVKKRYASESISYNLLFQCTFFDGSLAWDLEKHVLKTLRYSAYKGKRLLKTASNKEMVLQNPVPNIQNYIKDIYAKIL